MASSSAGTELSDALSKLRIKRADPRPKRSWLRSLLKFSLVVGVLAGIAATGIVVSSRNGWLSAETSWLNLPEVMQAQVDGRLATLTVETGRAAKAVVKGTGYIESRRQARIGARSPGRMATINVEEGSRVKSGEVLAVLEHADLDASLAAVAASLARARAALEEQEIVIAQSQRDFERAERLWKTKQIAESNYDDAKYKAQSATARRASLLAEIDLAEARLSEAQQMKENMFIRAPFDGTVISKDAEVGESILPGGMGEASGRGSAVTVADLDHLEVDCDMQEGYIGRIAPGQSAEIEVDAVPKERFQGRVRKVIPKGNRARATIKVKVAIVNSDERLFPDMSATVYFLSADSSATEDTRERRVFCESEAIGTDDASQFVWVADDKDRVRRQEVTTGAVRDGRTEITSGLSGSERVIIAPPGVRTGQRMKITR